MKDRERDRKKRKGHIQKERWRDEEMHWQTDKWRQRKRERKINREIQNERHGLLFI
jgi:hypothetical protein